MGSCCTAKNKNEEIYEECRDKIPKSRANKEVQENAAKPSAGIEDLEDFLANAPHFTSHNEGVNVVLWFLCRNLLRTKAPSISSRFLRMPHRELSSKTPTPNLVKVTTDLCIVRYKNRNCETRRDGIGVLIYRNGSRFDGYFMNGLPEGRGRTVFISGDVHEGLYHQGKPHGKGMMERADESRYEGEFKDGRQHGKGTETWSDGSCYEGNYANDAKEGFGKLKWPNKSEYVGEFRDNSINGAGIYRWPDGKTYNGEWKDYQMHGKGVFTWPDGRKYKGEYVLDYKEGEGVMEW
eukprot:TRINITY_DN10713_c0_g4_i2.p1 TRINITY_DN10713_c0_g4~~TRINITY_DN10713_c0_g4_i2.p1  ORF type:complete len:293 (-),score=67.71 TRINITY_DN10713_c0_g4_i2:769-1647(-)